MVVELLQSTGNKCFLGSREQIDFAENRPNPQDMHDEFLSASPLVPSFSRNVQVTSSTRSRRLSKSISTPLMPGTSKNSMHR